MKKLEQEPNCSEIPTGSTTKNDLGVDCISRQATINAVKRIHPVDTDYDCTLYDKVDVMYVLYEMPSVTPQEPRCDAISREAVLKLQYRIDDSATLSTRDVVNVEDIQALSSVTPIRLKGHWISHREHCENLGVMPSGLGAYEWCSNCDCGIDVREWHRNHYNYCPNCGARMIEPQESEDKE